MKDYINEIPDGSPKAFLEAAQRYGLSLDPERIQLNNIGLDFAVAFATDMQGTAWVLRAPRRLDVQDKMKRERQVLALVSKHLPVAVPDWRVYSSDLIAYPLLPGTPALTISQETSKLEWHIDLANPPEEFLKSYAEVLAALHGIDQKAAAATGIQVLAANELQESMKQKMLQVRQHLEVPEALWEQWQHWLADTSCWPTHTALVHGDLHGAHILTDANGRLTSIIDWTEAEVTDPATDFYLFLGTFGEAALYKLLRHYEAAGGRVWDRMAEHIKQLLVAFPVNIALFAIITGNEADLAWARSALGIEEE